jgi:hypothetical protein
MGLAAGSCSLCRDRGSVTGVSQLLQLQLDWTSPCAQDTAPGCLFVILRFVLHMSRFFLISSTTEVGVNLHYFAGGGIWALLCLLCTRVVLLPHAHACRCASTFSMGLSVTYELK